MANSLYKEVTAVPFGGYERDRVLDKLKTPATSLPFSLQDIRISHNDFAIADVYNDSIRKLYSNYLFLIANAEITTKTSPTTGDFGYWSFDSTFTSVLCSSTTLPVTGTSTQLLSSTKETHIAKKSYSNDSNDYLLYFNYSPDQSIVFESTTTLSLSNTLLSGNFVEFNKTFKFKDVVSVDIVNNLLFVLDKELNTVFKFDISGLLTNDPALRRTGKDDSNHPGRYLLKMIGGLGFSQTKNKLNSPSCLSVHDNRVYILDNGHHSLKVFDLDFNFIDEVHSLSRFGPVGVGNPNTGELVSIVVDERSDTDSSPHGYILTNKGKILEYDVSKNVIGEPHSPFNIYDTRLQAISGFNEDQNFNKIVNSKSSKNILYISTNRNIFKFYKTNFNLPITTFDFSKANFILGTTETTTENPSANKILSFDSTLHNDVDYLAVTTTPFSALDTSNVLISPTVTYVFGDKDIPTKLYHDNFYTNYFSLSDILILPQETVSNINFNKTTKKLIYNHFSLFENLNKKVYSYYDNIKGTFLMPTLCTINYNVFDLPSNFTIDNNFYIGVNEPLLTDVINRPLELLYNQQQDLFNLIKEESLNSDPPSDVPARLPAVHESASNVLSLTGQLSETVTGGSVINIGVKRENNISVNNTCTFSYYMEAEDAIQSTFNPYIAEAPEQYETFSNNEILKPLLSINTGKFFTGSNRVFKVIIKQRSDCIVNPDKQTYVGTLTPIGALYTIELSGINWSAYEGDAARIGITRYDSSGQYTEDSICNISVLPYSNILSTEFTPYAPASNTYAYVAGDFSNGPDPFNSMQLSAGKIGDTSTLHFTPGISSLVFDLSVLPSYTGSKTEQVIEIKINNANSSSAIGSQKYGLARFNEQFKTLSLFLSDISATYRADTTSDTLLSCVNVWEALSANETFIAVSATNPISASFTVNEPLSVFSVSALSGALQFDAPANSILYTNNAIDFIIESNSSLVGKGGQGGHGAVWLSGADFSKTTGIGAGDLSASNAGRIVDVIPDEETFDGGPALGNFDAAFQHFNITNRGAIYGGGGGGGGGLLGVSATSMDNVSSLSAGAGGGGGAGIHTENCGPGGLASVQRTEVDDVYVYTQIASSPSYGYSPYGYAIVADGSAGTVIAGGAGGGFLVTNAHVNNPTAGWGGGGDQVPLATYPPMAGTTGGNIGLSGVSDSSTAFTLGDVSGISETGLVIRTGGKPGKIISTQYRALTTNSTGTFSGEIGNIR